MQDGCAKVGNELRNAIEDNGFRINDEKVYLQSNKNRQRVTGLIINSGRPNVPRRFVRQIRAMIYACKKYGIDAANQQHAGSFYRRQLKRSEKPSIVDVISGKLEFIRSVKGDGDKVLKNLQKQFISVNPGYFEVMKMQNNRLNSRDFFISHASEDKELIAKPLAEQLIRQGYTVWYDEYETLVGESIRERIDHGLSVSKFGIVILSPAFFSKSWTKKELDGLCALESDNSQRILPIWHGVDQKQVREFSPTLAGRKAATGSVPQIVDDLARRYKKQSNGDTGE